MVNDWPNVDDYWNERKDFQYFQIVYDLIYKFNKNPNSILDVGTFGCPYLECFKDVKYRTSIDLVYPYKSQFVKSVKNDFLIWKPDREYDIVTCLQVIHMSKNPIDFAQKLLLCGKLIVVSVPYKSKNNYHYIDEKIMKNWFELDPIYSDTCSDNIYDRLIQVYIKQ